MADQAAEQEEDFEGCEVDYGARGFVPPVSTGSVRTFFVFIDLPQHIEFRAGEMPLLPKGTELELDMCLRHPRNPKKVRKVQGVHTVVRRVLKFTSSRPSLMGLSQYLELAKGPTPR